MALFSDKTYDKKLTDNNCKLNYLLLISAFMDIKQECKKRELHLGVLVSSDVKVWRYLDFPKFISLLESSALNFFRSDLFSDEYDGSLTESAIKFRDVTWRDHMPSIPDERFKHLLEQYSFQLAENRKRFYINCWHMN